MLNDERGCVARVINMFWSGYSIEGTWRVGVVVCKLLIKRNVFFRPVVIVVGPLHGHLTFRRVYAHMAQATSCSVACALVGRSSHGADARSFRGRPDLGLAT